MQPVAGYQYATVGTGVGTNVVVNSTATLVRVIVPGTYVGTLNVHDASSATGTTATSQIFSLGLPTTSIPQSIEVGVGCRNGILYQATGTPAVTLIWR